MISFRSFDICESVFPQKHTSFFFYTICFTFSHTLYTRNTKSNGKINSNANLGSKKLKYILITSYKKKYRRDMIQIYIFFHAKFQRDMEYDELMSCSTSCMHPPICILARVQRYCSLELPSIFRHLKDM